MAATGVMMAYMHGRRNPPAPKGPAPPRVAPRDFEHPRSRRSASSYETNSRLLNKSSRLSVGRTMSYTGELEPVQREEVSPLANPHGPMPWVEGTCFQVAIMVVVVLNSVVIGLEQKFTHYDWWPLEQLLLGVYCTELGLRLNHLGCGIFFTHPDEKYWNWLDFLVVLTGVFDQWVLPLLVIQHHGKLALVMSGTRLVRVARFLRLLKVLRVYLTVDLRWTDSAGFQTAVGAIIFFNAILIGMETDYEGVHYWWIEQALLVFFVFELAVRLRKSLTQFFVTADDLAWNYLDLFIVLAGVLDQWLVPALEELGVRERHDHDFGKVLMLVRMLRLLRILRLVRLVKIVRPLYNLAQGILEALQGMFWVLVITIMFLYVMSIIATRMIGHGLILSEEDKRNIPPETLAMFSSIFASMYTLFEIISGWSLKLLAPLLERIPWLTPVFVGFAIFTGWTLLSIMTGVVSENMVAIREGQERENRQKEEERRKGPQKALRAMFSRVDADKSGSVDREEFETVLRDPKEMSKLMKMVRISVSDLEEIFTFLDVDGDGRISIDEFIEGFRWVNEPLSGKHILKLEGCIRNIEHKLQEDVSAEVRNSVIHHVGNKLDDANLNADFVAKEVMKKIQPSFQQLQDHVADGYRQVTEQVTDLCDVNEENLATFDRMVTETDQSLNSLVQQVGEVQQTQNALMEQIHRLSHHEHHLFGKHSPG